MKVNVDFSRCQSSALCVQIQPEVFEVQDDGFLYVLVDELQPGQVDAAEEAAKACPCQAITLTP